MLKFTAAVIGVMASRLPMEQKIPIRNLTMYIQALDGLL